MNSEIATEKVTESPFRQIFSRKRNSVTIWIVEPGNLRHVHKSYFFPSMIFLIKSLISVARGNSSDEVIKIGVGNDQTIKFPSLVRKYFIRRLSLNFHFLFLDQAKKYLHYTRSLFWSNCNIKTLCW